MFKVLDLFSGAGGFSLGFRQVKSMQVALAIDNDSRVLETYQFNHPSTQILCEDISELRSETIIDLLGSPPDIILASPPCEGFTSANRLRRKDPLMRLYDDEKGRLVLHTIRLIHDLKPKIFVLENVPQLLDGELRNALLHEFERIGQEEIRFNMLHAEHYGCPSRRTRLFISNIELHNLPKTPAAQVKAILRGLPDPRSIHDIPNHVFIPISEKKELKIHRLRANDSLIYYKGAAKVHTNWKRLDLNQICYTIIGNSRYVHPIDDRILTVREQARFMGWPDDYVFFGLQDEQFNQVGEAVPPRLAQAIAEYVSSKPMEILN